MSGTEGKWDISADIDTLGRSFIKAGPVRVYAGHTEASQAEALANAKLIAAAPEMLEALVSILGWREMREAENSFPVERVEEIAREAIAKAKS